MAKLIDELTVVKNQKSIEYLNVECAFDIESTSTTVAGENKMSFMYAWAFGMKDERYITRGRTWEELVTLCKTLVDKYQLNDNKRLVCYIHNLGYEFQFMRKYFEWDEVFAVDNRKPITARTVSGIEFRDSLILSGLRLELVAENLTSHTITKKIGQLDYSKVRHYSTPLTEDEWEYIEHDVIILLYYINEQLSIYNNIYNIPLTNTGRVRDYVRNKCYYTSKSHKKTDRNKYMKYSGLMKDLQLDEKTYKACGKAFQGGYVHANAKHSNKVIEGVTSADFISSYPAVMCSEKFPMSRPIKIKVDDNFDINKLRKNMNLIFTIRFTDLVSTIDQDSYISESHCERLVKPVMNNGRVFSADELVMTITDVDFDIIQNTYEWSSMTVANVYGFYKGYLPKSIIEAIAELYEAKTVYKGVDNKEEEYTLSKGMLNAIYGMTVTDIVKGSNEYEDDWTSKDANVSEVLRKYNNSKKRFLYYPWGVFVTAYARRNLWLGIMAMGDDYVYSDTDAIKFTNGHLYHDFLAYYNNMITRKINKMCEFHNLDSNIFAPCNKYGEQKQLGVWEIDGEYSLFKTLGAKRYMVEHADTNELELTCSGLGKSEGIEYLKELHGSNVSVLKNFNDDLHIPADRTGKMVHTYIDEPITTTIMDHVGTLAIVTSLSSVHLEEEEYNLSMTEEYIKFMENIQKGYVFNGNKRLV